MASSDEGFIAGKLALINIFKHEFPELNGRVAGRRIFPIADPEAERSLLDIMPYISIYQEGGRMEKTSQYSNTRECDFVVAYTDKARYDDIDDHAPDDTLDNTIDAALSKVIDILSFYWDFRGEDTTIPGANLRGQMQIKPTGWQKVYETHSSLIGMGIVNATLEYDRAARAREGIEDYEIQIIDRLTEEMNA